MEERVCYLCMKAENGDHLDRHHVFGGPNRKKSEKYGAVVYLHHNSCHIFGKQAVHNNIHMNRWIQRRMQKRIMREQGWDMDRWIREFGKNYLVLLPDEQSIDEELTYDNEDE